MDRLVKKSLEEGCFSFTSNKNSKETSMLFINHLFLFTFLHLQYMENIFESSSSLGDVKDVSFIMLQ